MPPPNASTPIGPSEFFSPYPPQSHTQTFEHDDDRVHTNAVLNHHHPSISPPPSSSSASSLSSSMTSRMLAGLNASFLSGGGDVSAKSNLVFHSPAAPSPLVGHPFGHLSSLMSPWLGQMALAAVNAAVSAAAAAAAAASSAQSQSANSEMLAVAAANNAAFGGVGPAGGIGHYLNALLASSSSTPTSMNVAAMTAAAAAANSGPLRFSPTVASEAPAETRPDEDADAKQQQQQNSCNTSSSIDSSLVSHTPPLPQSSVTTPAADNK